jgi:hypothetical protein
MDALRDFPDYETKLKTEKGDAVCQKQDIFKGLMWYAYTDNFAAWHVLNTEQVKEIMAINKDGGLASALEDYAVEVEQEVEKTYNNVVGQESITRFDQPKKKNRNKSKNRNKGNGREGAVVEGQPRAVSPDKNQGQRNNQPQRNHQNRPAQQQAHPKDNSGTEAQGQPNTSEQRANNRNKRNKKRPGNRNRGNSNESKNNEGTN